MDNLPVLWIVLLPLAGAIMNGLAGRFASRRLVAAVAVGSVAGAFALAVSSFIELYRAKHGDTGIEDPALIADVYTWFSIGVPSFDGGFLDLPIQVRFVFDSLSGLMTLVVTGIGTLIHIYSLGYMSEEKSYARFFAYLNLFTASMLILVLASSLPLMFVGWEGVGLCSYLLIGFWYENPKYAAAGRKAFIANRVGDFGVLIGMFALVFVARSFEFTEINAAAGQLGATPFIIGDAQLGTVATFATLFLFLGCTGKSAQIPLYVWLPDAMAGPTPVSALIHAATMVTAGVYLCCRLSPVFLESATTLSVIAIVGALTAFLAATIAVVQKEMKKILAYSTVSQLGFMFAAVGVGAFAAGFFHVFTHAFFKACLFLGAGSVMHAVHAHGDANIFKLGGMKKFQPITRWTFLLSCAAIAGVPLFSGFFSKDEILLGAANVAFNDTMLAPWVGWFVLVVLFLAATMTAFYMYRLYYLTFTGDYRSAEGHGDGEHADEEHGDDHAGDDDHGHGYDPHPHESEGSMTFPLIVLGAGATLVGLLGLPHAFHLPNWWGHWMEPSIAHLAGFGPTDEIPNMTAVYVAMAAGIAAMAIGVGGATVLYRNKNEDTFTTSLPKKLFDFLFDKWRVDELYDATIIRFNKWAAMLAGRIDKSFVDAILTKWPAWGVQGASWLFTRLQVGVVHAYGLVLVVGMSGLAWWFFYPQADVEVETTMDSATLVAGRGLGYEYRFDVDGDGAFDVPAQPTRVTLDLDDDIGERDVLRVVALVRAAIAPEPWPADRAALGRLVSASGNVYELQPPVEALEDLEAALERSEAIESVTFEPIDDQPAFTTTAEARGSYDEEDYLADRLVLLIAKPRSTANDHLEVGVSPRVLTGDDLSIGWQASESNSTPMSVHVTEEGKLLVRPNGAVVQYQGEFMDPEAEFEMAVGEGARFGGALVRVLPIVQATVEVRNAFGNVSRETLDITLEAAPGSARVAEVAR